MTKPWILDREDPRTAFVVCVIVLVIGAFVVPQLYADGGVMRVLGMIWLAVALAELVWSGRGVITRNRVER